MLTHATYQLPVIVGFGGINAAGRSSFFQNFDWIAYDALAKQQQAATLQALQILAHQPLQLEGKSLADLPLEKQRQFLKQQTFIRKVAWPQEPHFSYPVKFANLPAFEFSSHYKPEDGELEKALAEKALAGFLQATKKSAVHAAAQLPSFFDPAGYYNSKNHPRGLQMAVYGVSDALASLGLEVDSILSRLDYDQVGVYASSMLGQLDEYGISGYIKARSEGKRPTSKQFPLSMPQMTADFINAYVLASLGHTFAGIGACATFLYNLHYATQDIQHGLRKFAIVGASDAPILPEVIDAYAAMGALCTDDDLRKLDQLTEQEEPNYSRACRPFAENKGFVLGESAQFLILSSLDLALEAGLPIYGAVAGVAIHADGQKNSITKPGSGNYFSLLKMMGLAEAILTRPEFKHETFVSAHATGTPQNRVTESRLLSLIAENFGLEHWPVCAVKNYLGHSTAPAAGDQIITALGSFERKVIPAISSTERLAEDVFKKGLHYCLAHETRESLAAALINSKGFGGNNASALILAPKVVDQLSAKLYTEKQRTAYKKTLENTLLQREANEQKILSKEWRPKYHAVDLKEDFLDQVQLENGVAHWGGRKMRFSTSNPYHKS